MNSNLTREQLEAVHGEVWDTNEASAKFDFVGFMAPYAVVKDKETGKKGSVTFQHRPRFYFNFT